MAPSTWVVIGASRGIGLELVRQLLDQGNQVIAAVRSPETANHIWQLSAKQTRPAACLIEQCDVTDESSIDKLLNLNSAAPPSKIMFISSDSGSASLFRDHEDGFAAYGASKAALNQMLRHMAAELKRKGGSYEDVCVLAMHPGEVQT
ncbi:hypothetical protein FOPE_09868 [Fonsecaea pedrosoi]|nr:hypothetical protein FOPE_09868 [Fonsecaea pedrosoi]